MRVFRVIVVSQDSKLHFNYNISGLKVQFSDRLQKFASPPKVFFWIIPWNSPLLFLAIIINSLNDILQIVSYQKITLLNPNQTVLFSSLRNCEGEESRRHSFCHIFLLSFKLGHLLLSTDIN